MKEWIPAVNQSKFSFGDFDSGLRKLNYSIITQYVCKVTAAQKRQHNIYRHSIRERKIIRASPGPYLNIQQCYSKVTQYFV